MSGGQELAVGAVVQFVIYLLHRRLMTSIKDRIKAANDIDTEVIEIPEWDQVKIEVRSMTGRERAQLLKRATMPDGSMDFEGLYPSVLVACCFDPDSGDKVFDTGDYGWINEKAAGPVERLAQIGMKLSGLTQEAADEGKGSSS